MGYTHYFTIKKGPRGKAAQSEAKYQKAVLECTKMIQFYSKTFGGLSGYSAHSNKYQGINVNGSERVGQCEPFILREHLSQNEAFGFVKTRQYPYDTVVTACLIVLKHRLGELIEISSDGNADNFNDGLILARSVLGLKRIALPTSLRPNLKQPVGTIIAV